MELLEGQHARRAWIDRLWERLPRHQPSRTTVRPRQPARGHRDRRLGTTQDPDAAPRTRRRSLPRRRARRTPPARARVPAGAGRLPRGAHARPPALRARWRSSTARGWSTATSSPRTSSSAATARRVLIDFGLVSRVAGAVGPRGARGRRHSVVGHRRPTWRPSRSAASSSTRAPTSTRSAASSTRCVTGRAPFTARRTRRSSSSTCASRRAALGRSSPASRPRSTRSSCGCSPSSPRDRIGYADDVAAALADARRRRAAPSAARAAARATSTGPELVGRDESLGELGAALDAASDRAAARSSSLGGESGVGKTCLARRRSPARPARGGLRVVAGECAALGGRRAARDAGSAAPPAPAAAPGGRRPRASRAGPTCAERLLGPRGQAARRLRAGARARCPVTTRTRRRRSCPARRRASALLDALAGTLAAFAAQRAAAPRARRPPVGRRAVAELPRVARRPRPSRRRGARRGRRLPVARRRAPRSARWSQAPHVARRSRSAGSTSAAPGADGRRHAGDGGAAGAVRRASWSRHSEGNPFFVAEYLRAAVAEGLLRAARRGVEPLGAGAGGHGSRRSRSRGPCAIWCAAASTRSRRRRASSPSRLGARARARRRPARGRRAPRRRRGARPAPGAPRAPDPRAGGRRARSASSTTRCARWPTRRIEPARRRRSTSPPPRRSRPAARRTRRSGPSSATTSSTRARWSAPSISWSGPASSRSASSRTVEATRHFEEAIALEPRLRARAPALRRARWHTRIAEAEHALGRPSSGRAHAERAAALLDLPVPGTRPLVALDALGELASQALHRAFPGRFVSGVAPPSARPSSRPRAPTTSS